MKVSLNRSTWGTKLRKWKGISIWYIKTSKAYTRWTFLAIYYVKRVWNGLSSDIIKSSWQHTQLIPVSDVSSANWNAQDDLEIECFSIERHIVDIVPFRSRMAIGNLFNAPREEDCTEKLSAGMPFLEDCEREGGSQSALQKTEPVGHALPSLHDELKTLSPGKRIICSRHDSGHSSLPALRRGQASIRLEVFSRARQSTMPEFFN